MPNPYPAEFTGSKLSRFIRLFGTISFTDPANQPSGSGGVNSVTAGDASVAVGGTVVDPTVAVAPLGVTAAKIAAKSVSAAKLESGAAAAGQIATADGAGNVAYVDPAIKDVSAGDASVVVGGIAGHPTIVTADLATIAALHAATGDVPLNGHKLTGLANGSGPADAAAFGQIPTTLPPSGSAGGDLAGSYPNPGVAAVQGVAVSSTPPTAGQVLTAADATHAAWATGGGGGGFAVVDYVQRTTSLSVTATTEATAQTYVTGAGFTADGTSFYLVEFYSPTSHPDAAGAGRSMTIVLFEGSTALGQSTLTTPAAGTMNVSPSLKRRLQPTAGSHTYLVAAFVSAGSGVVGAGAGGSGQAEPAYIMVTKLA